VAVDKIIMINRRCCFRLRYTNTAFQ